MTFCYDFLLSLHLLFSACAMLQLIDRSIDWNVIDFWHVVNSHLFAKRYKWFNELLPAIETVFSVSKWKTTIFRFGEIRWASFLAIGECSYFVNAPTGMCSRITIAVLVWVWAIVMYVQCAFAWFASTNQILQPIIKCMATCMSRVQLSQSQLLVVCVCMCIFAASKIDK